MADDVDMTDHLKADLLIGQDGDLVTIQSKDNGKLLMEQLRSMRDVSGDGILKVMCADGVLHVHREVLAASTGLLEGMDCCEEMALLCLEYSAAIMARVLNVLYTGWTDLYPGEENEVRNCLKSLMWIGRDDRHDEESSDNQSESLDMKRPSSKKYSNSMQWLKRFPDLQTRGKRLYCDICDTFIGAVARGEVVAKKHAEACGRSSTSVKSSSLMKVEAEDGSDLLIKTEHEEVGTDDRTTAGEEYLDDLSPGSISGRSQIDSVSEDDPELEEEIESKPDDLRSCSNIEVDRRSLSSSKMPLAKRLLKIGDLMEFEGNILCTICKVQVDCRKGGRIMQHMKSVKHNRRKAIQEGSIVEQSNLTFDRDLDGNNQDQDLTVIAAVDEEKLSKRLEEFPWLRKMDDAVICIFCKSSISWVRRTHIMEHFNSKRHRKSMDLRKSDYPDLLRKMEETDKISSKNNIKHSNNGKQHYRILLKCGTPAIQKLWATGILTGSIVTDICICYLCYKLFSRDDDLDAHLKSKHQGTANRLVNNPHYKNDTKEYYCSGCSKFTEAKKSVMCFLVHNLICSKTFHGAGTPLTCFGCPQRMNNFKQFKEHVESSHCDLLPERLMCSHCPQSFLTNEELKRHVGQVHSEQSFPCDQCSTTFRSKKSLSQHVVKLHIGVKNFSCEQCGKEFYGKQNLRMHARTHLAPDQRPHGCHLCGLRFIERKHLLNHEATHTNERPHKCCLCDSRFKVRDWLGNHYIKQHGISIKEIEASHPELSSEAVESATRLVQSGHHKSIVNGATSGHMTSLRTVTLSRAQAHRNLTNAAEVNCYDNGNGTYAMRENVSSHVNPTRIEQG